MVGGRGDKECGRHPIIHLLPSTGESLEIREYVRCRRDMT